MTAPPVAQKISSAEIYEHFDKIELTLERMQAFGLRRPPLLLYKPRRSGDGKALKMDLNITPIYLADSVRVVGSEGGLFVEVVDQAGEKNGHPAFAWGDKEGGSITMKLGIPDITSLLAGIRHMRYRQSRALPESMTSRNKPADPLRLSMVHKFNDKMSVMNYKFTSEGAFLQLWKSKDYNKTISLTLAEEIAFEEYLRGALQQFLNSGLR